MSNEKMNIDVSQVVTSNPAMAQRVRNLNILVPRVKAIMDRWGLNPFRTIFVKYSDQKVLDDLVYPLGVPVSKSAWYYGKAVQQQRSRGYGGHVFEFANISNPAHVVLGTTNDLVMDLDVIIHAWAGHVNTFSNNVWHKECEAETVLQRMAQYETFQKALVTDTVNWGWERYEYYDDAAHALEMHSGPFMPHGPHEVVQTEKSDEELRAELRLQLQELENRYKVATSEPDRKVIADDIRDTARLLTCHPIVPTSDILGFYADEKKGGAKLPPEVRHILAQTRFENRYSTQVLGRTKIIHEGDSHFKDERMPTEPELDLMHMGFDLYLDNAKNNVMHDAYPIYWYSDPYALGQEICKYVYDLRVKKVGTETVTFRRLSIDENGDIQEGELISREIDKWDRSGYVSFVDTFDDYRMFDTFLTEHFFEEYLNKKALAWVNKMIMVINRTLRERGWDPSLIFDGERLPKTLFDTYQVISTWMNQLQLSGMMSAWFGYGSPAFPVSQVALQQMLQIIQIISAWDEDKVEYKRNMLLRTGLSYQPNIKLVDTGLYNNAGFATLRHEFDPDFGPLRESHARSTLKYMWRISGPVRLLTMEILTDSMGRPWGPPRPYQYFTDNGETVKERWLQ